MMIEAKDDEYVSNTTADKIKKGPHEDLTVFNFRKLLRYGIVPRKLHYSSS